MFLATALILASPVAAVASPTKHHRVPFLETVEIAASRALIERGKQLDIDIRVAAMRCTPAFDSTFLAPLGYDWVCDVHVYVSGGDSLLLVSYGITRGAAAVLFEVQAFGTYGSNQWVVTVCDESNQDICLPNSPTVAGPVPPP